jgi:ubiquinone/menaquinone biosynthesis C-methylase UbiE
VTIATASDARHLPNHSLKEDIRAYWSKRAESFDQSTGHRIEDTAEAPTWRALIREAFGDIKGRRVLDLACGTGEISRMLLDMGADVTGVDFAEPMLSRAKTKHAGRAFRGVIADVEDLKLEADASYDAVVTRHLVWTLVNPHAAFAEWRRVLKPGGRLLVMDGDWINAPLTGRLMRALAERLAPRDGMHGGVDMAEHDQLAAQVHYSAGLTAAKLAADLAAHGFSSMRRHSVRPIYWRGMRKAPLGDRLRLLAARRFALSAAKASDACSAVGPMRLPALSPPVVMAPRRRTSPRCAAGGRA